MALLLQKETLSVGRKIVLVGKVCYISELVAQVIQTCIIVGLPSHVTVFITLLCLITPPPPPKKKKKTTKKTTSKV